jgi:hypothetical protein
MDTKIGVIIKKVHLLEHIKLVNRNARWNSEIRLFLQLILQDIIHALHNC